MSSRWSSSSFGEGLESITSSLSRNSDEIQEFLDRSLYATGLERIAGNNYSESVYEDSLQPDPLHVKKDPTEGYMRVTTEVNVVWEDNCAGEIGDLPNDELLAYLNA